LPKRLAGKSTMLLRNLSCDFDFEHEILIGGFENQRDWFRRLALNQNPYSFIRNEDSLGIVVEMNTWMYRFALDRIVFANPGYVTSTFYMNPGIKFRHGSCIAYMTERRQSIFTSRQKFEPGGVVVCTFDIFVAFAICMNYSILFGHGTCHLYRTAYNAILCQPP
jgi:hypothetical protein